MQTIEEYKTQIDQTLATFFQEKSNDYQKFRREFAQRLSEIQLEIDDQADGTLQTYLIDEVCDSYLIDALDEPFPDFLLRFLEEGLQGHVLGKSYIANIGNIPCGCWYGQRLQCKRWAHASDLSNAITEVLERETDVKFTFSPIENWLFYCAQEEPVTNSEGYTIFPLVLNPQTNIPFLLFLQYLVGQCERLTQEVAS